MSKTKKEISTWSIWDKPQRKTKNCLGKMTNSTTRVSSRKSTKSLGNQRELAKVSSVTQELTKFSMDLILSSLKRRKVNSLKKSPSEMP